MFLGLIALAGYTAFLKLYGATVGIEDVGGFFLLYGGLVLGDPRSSARACPTGSARSGAGRSRSAARRPR